MTNKEKVFEYLNKEAKVPLLEEELANILVVPSEKRGELKAVLDELISDGQIIRSRRGRYGSPEKMGFASGRFISNERGFGFVETRDGKSDIFIPASCRERAMHHDTVFVKIDELSEYDRRSGSIVSVIKRCEEPVVGEYRKNSKSGFVIADSKKIQNDIYISEENSHKASNGDKVIVKVISWDDPQKNPEGEIIEILGGKNDLGVDVLSIAKEHGIKTEFDPKTLWEAKACEGSVNASDIKGRLDLRGETIITIDGEDAKDLDDAVSLVMEENGNYSLGVHIADVGHYVRYGSALDREALKRGTSVYLSDRVIPMLPEELSNGICSLNPHEDRLTLSVIMEIDSSGDVVGYKISKSVINTCERMTYIDVTAILEGDKLLIKKYAHIADMLKRMRKLSELLYKKRSKRGSIDFDFPEAKIIYNENNEPIDIKRYEYTMSNKIIEEFMLICNETVAEHMYWHQEPFIYRVHEVPSDDKIADFAEFIGSFGYTLKRTKNKLHPKEFQKLLKLIKDTKEERIISTVMLRSLMKARYTHENLGHFGLAAKYYCHFTSPIRRYPDLVIHRIIKESVEQKTISAPIEFIKKAARASSDAEIAAMEAERECENMKKAEYMSAHVGETYEGVISSVTPFGLFVELENTVEGLVSMTELNDDYYEYDEKNKRLIGTRTNRIYSIGDDIKVVVLLADKLTRRIDFGCAR